MGNLARSLGPMKCRLGWVCKATVDEVAPKSTSGCSVRLFLADGWSNHLCMAASVPCPSCLLGLCFGWLTDASEGGGLARLGCDALMRSGSPLCCGHVCQGRSHLHRQCLTYKDRLHVLHQILLSRLLTLKALLVPGSWCVHRGHWK